MDVEALPRISSRLLLHLYDQQVASPEELRALRKTTLDRIQRSEGGDKAAFTIDRFLPPNADVSPDIANEIRRHYKAYLQVMSSLASDSVLHKNAANTMFNLIAKKSSVEQAYSDAQSYFGFIDKAAFNDIVQHVQALRKAAEESSLGSGGAQVEFGHDIHFEIPTSTFDRYFSLRQFSKPTGDDEYVAPVSEEVKVSEDEDLDWFLPACEAHVKANANGMSKDEFSSEILKICKNSSYQGDLEMRLFELIGEADLELLMQVVQHAEQLKTFDPKKPKKVTNKPTPAPVKETAFENMTANQKKKFLQREQKELELALKASHELDGGGQLDWLQKVGFSEEYLSEERSLGLQKNRTFESWTENLAPEGTREIYENRGLPAGATRKVCQGYEEVFIPAAQRPPAPGADELVSVSMLEPWAQLAFKGTKSLNRIQSAVFQCAYFSNENMLVCAPTGAGKTNIAMLTLLQLIRQHVSGNTIDKTAFKAIYIAPMKALAQEVVTKFAERLAPLGLTVREFTGDMQLTRQEIAESNLLVCTPEKYDVATRKGGDGSLGTLVSLIIIDEVHLLADERGAVIETIVARTQRFVESSQKMIRIVGLSATLPNYQDVGTFLRVNPSTGLHFFGPEFRPIPLDQTFLGVTEKQRVKRNDAMNRLAYEKMIAALDNGKQVMIFVHSRKDTSRTLEAILDLCAKYATYDRLENVHHEKYTLWKRDVDKSKSIEVQNLFYKGVGVHHAGMLRADRNLVEQLFECGLIKVLCCTATLAWGVNLPAHTVIIKGTEMYDPERGGFVDLSILDVLQIFGRAGRPQYDNTGHAILITPHKSLNMYLGMLAQQAPIESAMIKALADHLNAEIVNGTVNNIKEAAAWLSYTFLIVRMKRNPLSYGIKYEDLFTDPQLEQKRLDLVKDAADTLDNCMMCRYDKRSGNLAVTDLGRIASHYYLKHSTIEAFNHMLAPHLSDPDAVHVLCSSAEFDQLKVRPEELPEIDNLKKHTFLQMKTSTDDTAGKVSVLLQGYLSHAKVTSFTLQSDTNYVAQNAGRIARALFEICLKRGWSSIARYYLCLCKSIDRRVRIDHSPLRQFPDIPVEVFKKLEDNNATYDRLIDMDSREIGQLIHNQKLGPKIKDLVRRLPMLEVEAAVQPITRGIVRLTINLTASFDWVDRFHGFAEPFWIWVEDGDNEYVYHSEYLVLQKKQKDEVKTLEVTIPVKDPLPSQYFIRVMSDVWVGCESVTAVSFQNVHMPAMHQHANTDLLNLHPVPKSALRNPLFEELYSFSHFNPIQSQSFHALYNTDRSVLIGAPTGSGKTITAELAILRLLREKPGSKTIYVAPLKALARERLMDWQRKLGQKLGLRVLELSGDVTPDIEDLRRADILIVTPEKWDGISRGWQKRDYVKRVGLVIIDEIHLLGVDRGPVLEIIVSRMRFIAAQTGQHVRFVGLSTALANARDLGDWLGIEEGTSRGAVGLYNFRPSVRPVPMSIHIQGFPGKHYCPRMATMNKPAYAAILEHSPSKPVLIFVSSRRQTRLTALDLISYCAADDDPRRFLHMEEDVISSIASTIKDKALRDTLAFGVGIHHAGLDNHDRSTVEELFLNNKIQVLVCTSTLAWGVNLPCHLVIVKGTEYFDGKSKGYVDFPVTDILQMMGRAGRPQFDKTAVACIFVHEPKKNFYRKFLHEPFPVESSLHGQLHEHFNAEIANGSIHNIQDAIEYLTWTYFFRRLLMNPTYYQLEDTSPQAVQEYLSNMVGGVLKDLHDHDCIEEVASSESANATSVHASYQATPLGVICSFYYLHYRTPKKLQLQFEHLMTYLHSTNADEVPVDILMKILCDAAEFSELPVRHNEEHLNAELAEQLGFDAQSSLLGSMESAHTKAFLLLHAYLRKAKLPIADYINDTKSVLDQVPRVLNAMIDIAAEYGYLNIVFALTKLSQLIKQVIPDNKSAEFMQLPGMTEAVAKELRRKGVNSLHYLLRQGKKAQEGALRQAFDAAESGAIPSELLRKLEVIPQLRVDNIRVREYKEDVKSRDVGWMELDGQGGLTIPANADCELEVKISPAVTGGRDNNHSFGAQKKAASWWILLVQSNEDTVAVIEDEDNNAAVDNNNARSESSKKKIVTKRVKLPNHHAELIALKRVGNIREHVTTHVLFTAPLEATSWPLRLYLVNDSFVGADLMVMMPQCKTY